MKIQSIITLLGIAMLLVFCKKDNEEALYGNEECEPENVSFSKYIQPLLNNACNTTGCHVQGGSGRGLFENYDQVKSKIDKGSFQQRVLVLKDMPPSQSLSDCQLKTIQKWIDEGAQDN
tara:strand:- start:276 stop:632 length:357 start_codon:yes stop_codon:yes gene_type:complete